MKTEVCGVLIGSMQNATIQIEACIAGKNAAQAGTHVTFTQDTWEHIYKVKDEQYPNDRIVGWYHSHPGFGVFLSDHDTFIHRNFFSASEQVAWVYDPHSDDEGFFGWTGERITRIGQFTFSDSRGGEDSTRDEGPRLSMLEDTENDFDVAAPAEVSPKRRKSQWLQRGISALSYVLAVVVGFLIARLLFPYFLVVDPQTHLIVDPQTGRVMGRLPDNVFPSSPPPPPQVVSPATNPPPTTSAPEQQKSTADPSKKSDGSSEAKRAQ